jgi:hypothetical protein
MKTYASEENPPIMQKTELAQLLFAANQPYANADERLLLPLKAYVQQQLYHKPLRANARLVAFGRTPRRREELKQQIQNANLFLDAKINKKTSHILIGSHLTPQQIEFITKTTLPVLLPEQLEAYIQAQNNFFSSTTDENPEITDLLVNPIAELFATYEEENTLIALEILQANGLPHALITDVFIAANTQRFSNACRRQARNILKINAQHSLLSKINAHKPLDAYAFNPAQVCPLLADNLLDYKKIIRFLKILDISNFLPPEAYIALFPDHEQLDELQTLAQKNNYTLQLNFLSNALKPLACQLNIFRHIQYSHLGTQNASNIDFILHSTHTEYLNFTYSGCIAPYLAHFSQFERLHTLDLSHCQLSQLPPVFYAMPNLREIRLKGNNIPIEHIHGDTFDLETYQRTKILHRY